MKFSWRLVSRTVHISDLHQALSASRKVGLLLVSVLDFGMMLGRSHAIARMLRSVASKTTLILSLMAAPIASWPASGTLYAGVAPFGSYETIQAYCEGSFLNPPNAGAVCTGPATCTLVPVHMFHYSCPDANTPVCEAPAVMNSAGNACEGGAPVPETAECDCDDGVTVGHPILPATGEKVLTHLDYEDSGSHGLSLKRTYRSSRVGGKSAAPARSGLGISWSHSYSAFLWTDGIVGTVGSRVRVMLSDGSARAFDWGATTSAWVPTNSSDTLTANSTGFLYAKNDDDSAWQFDTTGKLLTMTSRNGWVTSFFYSDSTTPNSVAPSPGLLIGVTNAFGRTLSFMYNAAGQLISVRPPNGQTINYVHDDVGVFGKLIKVVYPVAAGLPTSKTYLYENTSYAQLLTGIVDENGSRLATYAYDSQGRGISTQHAGGADLHTITYGAGTATVTDPLGTSRTYGYGIEKGKLAVISADKPSGGATRSAASRVQDINGLVTQVTDFLGVNTTYTWDVNRRLPLTTTKAAGLPEQQIHSTQWHPSFRLPALVTEPGKATSFTYDGGGNKLSETAVDSATLASRTTSWTYTPQGLLATVTAPSNALTQSYTYYGSTTFSPLQSLGSFDLQMPAVTLLIHGDGSSGSTAFTDHGPLGKTLSTTSGVSVSTSSKMFGTGAASFASGGYISVPSGTDFNFGSAPFTIEFYLKPTAVGNSQGLVSSRIGPTIGPFEFSLNGTAIRFIKSNPAGTAWEHAGTLPSTALVANAWQHVAIVGSGTKLSVYINGVASATTFTYTPFLALTGPLYIGRGGEGPFTGQMDDVRITKGFARYTSNFTPPNYAFPDVGPAVVDLNETGKTVGDLQSVTNAANHTTQYTLYNRAGQVRRMIDPKGVVTDITYTPRGWIASTTVTPPGGSARVTTYTYDNVGLMTQVALPDGTTLAYTYDAAHRLIGVADTKGNAVTYALDNMANRVGEQIKDPQNTLQRSITRVYDTLNRVQQVTGADN